MKANNTNDTMKKDRQALIPVLIALCIIPLVILTHDYQTEFTQFPWFNNQELSQIDSFEHAKSILTIIIGAIAAVIIGFTEYSNVQKKKRLFANASLVVCGFVGVYMLMVILSSVFSEHTNLVFIGGGYSQWQTMWVLLAYGALFLYAYLFINSENRGLLTIKYMMITTGILSLLGTLQTVGYNPLKWGWVQSIITSQSSVEGITFKDGVSSVILAFNNPNYVGPYIALVLPVVIAFIATRAFEDKTKMILCKVAGILIAIGLLITLKGAASSSGLIALLGGAVFAIIMVLSSLLSKKKPESDVTENSDATENIDATSQKTNMTKGILISVIAVVIIVAGGIFTFKSTFVQNTLNKVLQGGEDTRNIASIVNQKDELKVTLRNGEKFTLAMHFDANRTLSFTAYDEKKQPITVQPGTAQNSYVLADKRFAMITLTPNNFSVADNKVYSGFKFDDTPNAISWTFMNVDGEWKYYTPFGKFIKLREIENFGFKNHQNIANRRGFIWSRTIPLMKDYWFTGVGPNAFIIAFPNDDFVGSKRVGNNTTLVDKPHNSFLQTYIQTGGISAIAYAGLWVIYMIGSIRVLWGKKKYTDLEKLSLGLATGIFAFAISGITNDTIVGTQIIYWTLLGTGYAVNRTIVNIRNMPKPTIKNDTRNTNNKKKRK